MFYDAVGILFHKINQGIYFNCITFERKMPNETTLLNSFDFAYLKISVFVKKVVSCEGKEKKRKEKYITRRIVRNEDTQPRY